jgi:hypothetical protein
MDQPMTVCYECKHYRFLPYLNHYCEAPAHGVDPITGRNIGHPCNNTGNCDRFIAADAAKAMGGK